MSGARVSQRTFLRRKCWSHYRTMTKDQGGDPRAKIVFLVRFCSLACNIWILTLKPCSTVYSSPDNQISIIPRFQVFSRHVDASYIEPRGWTTGTNGRENERGKKKHTTGITDLDTGLTNMHRDDFTHFDTMKRATTTSVWAKKGNASRNDSQREKWKGCYKNRKKRNQPILLEL